MGFFTDCIKSNQCKKLGLMYHFHAAEKSAHASWQVTRKHVNTQYLVYYKIPNQPPPPGQIGGYNF